jgi:hypothetical protein
VPRLAFEEGAYVVDACWEDGVGVHLRAVAGFGAEGLVEGWSWSYVGLWGCVLGYGGCEGVEREGGDCEEDGEFVHFWAGMVVCLLGGEMIR